MAEDPLDTLIRVLQERDIPYDRNALEKEYNNPSNGPEFQQWILEYLTPETLLTKDEAALYASLVESGEAERLAAQDLSQAHVLNEDELRTAIEELKRSTTNIEKQTEILKLQQTALDSLLKGERKTKDARRQEEERYLGRWDAERIQVTKELEDLSQNLTYQITEQEQHAKESQTEIRQAVDGVLRADDKLLLSLQKLATDLESAEPEDDTAIERSRELCARLIKHTVEGVRTRLDRVYLETIRDAGRPTGNEGNSQEAAELQEELESLYSEILPVAQMSAEQQFLQPAMKIIASAGGKSHERSLKAFQYIEDCLQYLTNRIDQLSQHAGANQTQNAALSVVAEVARKELSQQLNPLQNPPLSPTRSNTPRRRKSSVSQSPIKVRPLRRRSSGSNESLEPEHQIARNLGITLPTEADTDKARLEAMEQILSDRLMKLGLHNDSLRTAIESGISSHLQNSHATLNLLHDELLTETSHRRVKLLDPEIVGSVNTFAHDVQYVQTSMDEIDLQVLQGKNVKRDQIIERWTR